MGTSAMQDDPMLRLQYYRETGQPQEAQQYEQYLRETGQYRDATAAPSPALAKLHADYRSGALAQRTASANASDAQDAQGPGYFARLATHLLNTAQGIPGMESLEAGAGVVGSHIAGQPLSYDQSLNTLRDATGQIGGVTSAGEHMMGSLATMPFLPKNPMAAGALLGGGDQALNADPTVGVGGRVLRTAAGATGGALAGKFFDSLVAGGRAILSPNTSAQLLAKQAERAAGAKTLYGTALASGQGKAFTPQLKAYIKEPEIAQIIEGLQQTTHRGVPAESPEMLDAVYKTLSDQAKQAQKGLEQVDPSRANLGRFRIQRLGNLKGGLLNAMSSPGTEPALTMDVGPQVFETQPNIVPGREALLGPQTTMTAPPVTTAQSPIKTLRDALQDFHARPGIVAQRSEGTVQQRMARQALERHGAESEVAAVSGPLRGAPPPARSVTSTAFQMPQRAEQMVSPGVRIETPAMRVQTAPPRSVPAPMPGYQDAVNYFARLTREMEAIGRGNDALRNGLSKAIPTAKAAMKKTPEVFDDWLNGLTMPADRTAAAKGVLGGVKAGLQRAPLSTGRRAVLEAPGLLRTVDPNAGTPAILGLLGLHSLY